MRPLQTGGIPDGSSPGTAPIRGGVIGRFDQFSFASGRLVHPVYYAGDLQAPPILLLPEIAGFSPALERFAERLIDTNLRAGVSSPITTWLRALSAHISKYSGGASIGAIGMCLTGAFAIPLVIDPQVAAAVAAQPSVPLSPLFIAFRYRERKAIEPTQHQ
jgi:dienelactone hydrolase